MPRRLRPSSEHDAPPIVVLTGEALIDLPPDMLEKVRRVVGEVAAATLRDRRVQASLGFDLTPNPAQNLRPGQGLKHLRGLLGLERSELAQQMPSYGVSAVTLVENGHRWPRPEYFTEFANVMQHDPKIIVVDRGSATEESSD